MRTVATAMAAFSREVDQLIEILGLLSSGCRKNLVIGREGFSEIVTAVKKWIQKG